MKLHTEVNFTGQVTEAIVDLELGDCNKLLTCLHKLNLISQFVKDSRLVAYYFTPNKGQFKDKLIASITTPNSRTTEELISLATEAENHVVAILKSAQKTRRVIEALWDSGELDFIRCDVSHCPLNAEREE